MSESKQSDRWSRLSDAEKSFIKDRLRSLESGKSKQINSRPSGSKIPLSFAQERLWFFEQLEPNTPTYNRPWALRIKGVLNVQVLERCLNEIVKRHDSLRTTFPVVDGQPHQVIQSFSEAGLDFTDLRDVPILERERRAIQLAREETRRPFDLTQDPILRPFLIQMEESDHVLLLTTHHITFDGWSEKLLLNELAILYTAYLSNQPSPLLSPRIQYPDFAYWEVNQWNESRMDELVEFWREELHGAPVLHKLHTDRSRPSKLDYQGAMERIRIPHGLVRSIKDFNQLQGSTLFMTLLTAFNIVLYLNSGETDLIVGTPVAGRKFSELEEMIGFFVNTLVLRNNLEGNPTFQESLARVRMNALRAYEYQDLPFGKLVEIINPPRSASCAPIVQVSFSLRNIPISGVIFQDIEVDEFKFDSGIARFDFGLEAEEKSEGLFLTIFYNQDLFEKKTIDKALNQYVELLELVISNPDLKLSDLPFQVRKPGERKTTSPLQIDQRFFNESNLTGTQLLTWAGQKLRPEDPIYNLAYTARIYTKLDPQHFQTALGGLINSSDALRTTILEEDGIPLRVVLPEIDYKMPLVDFSKQEQPEVALEEWVDSRSHKQFDLAERLYDFALIKVSDEDWVWYLAIHHIIGDNWAVQLMFQRLQSFYEASLSNHVRDIQPFPEFESYFQYEQSHRNTQKFKTAETYWINKFSRPVVPLSLYGIRFPKAETRSQRVSLDLGQVRTQLLREIINQDEFFTKSEEASLLNAFTTLFFAYFYRASGNRDLAMATSFHNRRTPEHRETIGLFMEPLSLRVNIDETESFTSLNSKVTFETIETLKNRQYPLRNPIHSPIYEVVLHFHKVTFPKFLDKHTDFKRVHNHYDEDLLGIHIRDYEQSGSLKIDFDFNCTVFAPELRDRIMQDFRTILDAFLADPTTQIDQVELLTLEERRIELFKFNDTHRPFSREKISPQLFEEQVMKSPHQTAVLKGDDELTYNQLNERSNQAAHYLRSIGVQPDDIIGLHVDRSIDMIVGMLAIQKAGGAYLPLDPNLPKDRLALMIENSGANLILTQKHLKKRLSKNVSQVVHLDNPELFANESRENLETIAQPHNLAYVIYTSGSTGAPKGVMVEHRSLVNFMQWARRDWKLSLEDRILQFAAFSWDAHVEEIFPALSSGTTIVLRTEDMIDTFQGFLEQCRKFHITVLDLATAYWQELTDAIYRDNLEFPPAIRLVLTGGEKALKSFVETWLSKVGKNIRLLNTYGLTECTSISTQYDMRNTVPPDATGVPIGLPIDNVQTYVLDGDKNPVAIGLPGELWIGGIGLARGYLNHPQLTKEFYPPKHLDQTPGDRLLRTGDLARRLADGNLEILGRLDLQVKIRGFRIELGEIENVLNEHPFVQEAIVIAVDSLGETPVTERREKQLVAYYTVRQAHTKNNKSLLLQKFLKKKLPEYMVPSHFIELETFPYNSNGKVDRDSLPLPEPTDLLNEKTYQPPQTDLGKDLVAIWEEVLGFGPIGITDNFFELGGHSLLAVRLFSMIEKELSIKLPLAAFFESPTILSQARSIQEQIAEEGEMIVAVQAGGNNPPFFCVSPTIIDVMTYIELSKNMGADQPFYALYSQKLGQWRSGSDQRESIARQFIQKIREVYPHGPYFIGGYSAGGVIALEIVQQMRRAGLEVKLLVLLDTFGPVPPKRHPWVTPWIFNALLVIRRTQGYFWKFRLLDWKNRLDYLKISRIQSWARDRYKEVTLPHVPIRSTEEDPISLQRGRYSPDSYDGNVLLFRAEKGLLGVEYDPNMGWGEVFTGNFETCFVPGDHEAILFGPRSHNVAMKLNSYLTSASKTT